MHAALHLDEPFYLKFVLGICTHWVHSYSRSYLHYLFHFVLQSLLAMQPGKVGRFPLIVSLPQESYLQCRCVPSREGSFPWWCQRLNLPLVSRNLKHWSGFFPLLSLTYSWLVCFLYLSTKERTCPWDNQLLDKGPLSALAWWLRDLLPHWLLSLHLCINFSPASPGFELLIHIFDYL